MLNYIVWRVNPEIFSIPSDVWLVGGLQIRWYGLLFALSFIFGYYFMQKMFRHEGVSDKVLDQLTTYMIIFTIVGARLGHCFFYEPDYYLAHPIEILQIWKGGLASHGAAVGILTGLYFFARQNHKTYLWTLDRVVIVVALGLRQGTPPVRQADRRLPGHQPLPGRRHHGHRRGQGARAACGLDP